MKVLLAVDASPCSEAAVESVATLFSPTATEVLVFHAADWEQHIPPAYLFAEGASAARDILAVRHRIVRDAEARVGRVADRLRASGFTVRTEVRAEGDAPSAILDAAATWPADLILVGSHGRSGINRFLLGSVSERVVRHAPCSVQVVRLRDRTAHARHFDRSKAN
jgi:nucleotide-binding universal stress UspA family protein